MKFFFIYTIVELSQPISTADQLSSDHRRPLRYPTHRLPGSGLLGGYLGP